MATYTTEGIVLQKIDYSETSLILKVLTQDKGLQSFIFQGAKRKGKNGQIISPLSILNITYFQRKESDLSKISQVELAVVFKEIQFNPIKSSIIFFINEVLQKTIKEEESNENLYLFIKHTLQVLDTQKNSSNFPILFLIYLLKHLGYFPIIEDQAQYFDFLNGKLTNHQPAHPNYIQGEVVNYLQELFKEDLTSESIQLPFAMRQQCLNGILDYYKVVLDDFKHLKSLDVLAAILH